MTSKNGLLTYTQSTSYSCASDTAIPCSQEISQLNIAFNSQVVGATGTAINAVMDITKTVGTTSGIDIHMKQVSAAIAVAYQKRNHCNIWISFWMMLKGPVVQA